MTRRAWVYALLVLLCVPGIVGFDLWPLTGWRLFSLSRGATQTEWALDARTPNGSVRVDLERLPLAFRNAAWPLAELPGASVARMGEVCRALLVGVRAVLPEAIGLVIVLEQQRVVGQTRRVDWRESLHECAW